MCCISEYVDNTYAVGRLLQHKTLCCSMQPREPYGLQHLTSSSKWTVMFNKSRVVVCTRDHVPFPGVVSNFRMTVWCVCVCSLLFWLWRYLLLLVDRLSFVLCWTTPAKESPRDLFHFAFGCHIDRI